MSFAAMFPRDPHLDPHEPDCPRASDDPLGTPCTCSPIDDCPSGGSHEWYVRPESDTWVCDFCQAEA